MIMGRKFSPVSPFPKNSKTDIMYKTMEIKFSYLSLLEIFLASEWQEHNTDWKLWLNE